MPKHFFIFQFFDGFNNNCFSIYFINRSGSDWLRVVPYGIRMTLRWIKKEYPATPILVTENGLSDRNGSLVDTWRIEYYRSYINEVLKGKYLKAYRNCTVPIIVYATCKVIVKS